MPDRDRLLRGAPLLLVASSGGHLEELLTLADLLDAAPESHVVTFETAQSRHLLEGRPHSFVPYVGPRQLLSALRAGPTFRRLVRNGDWSMLVSTGAAVAVPALLIARSHGLRAAYVESFSRLSSPSMTGRIAKHVPGVETYTQHRMWEDSRWRYDTSILQAYSSAQSGIRTTGERPAQGLPFRIFVTLGTIRPYRFDAVVDAVLEALALVHEPVDITWQLGATTRRDLPGAVFGEISVGEFDRLAKEADLVVAHGGVGTCLRLVRTGVRPVVVPRTKRRGEHVDDHQEQIVEEFAGLGLCSAPDLLQLTRTPLVSWAQL